MTRKVATTISQGRISLKNVFYLFTIYCHIRNINENIKITNASFS